MLLLCKAISNPPVGGLISKKGYFLPEIIHLVQYRLFL